MWFINFFSTNLLAAFRATRDYDASSIVHTRGIGLQQSISQIEASSTVPSSSAPSDPIELDASQLTTHPEPSSSRRRPELLPRAKSFRDLYLYTPSKFQNIFEIIDALSDPRRHASDETSDLSDNESSARGGLDCLDSSRSPTPLKLQDVSLQVESDRPDVFRGINFSSVSVSSWPSNNKVIDKSRLGSDRPNSFKEFHSAELYKQQEQDSLAGPIRFTDLKRTRPEPKVDSEPQLGNGERFMRYLANESYINNKE